ncbi:MAG: alpha/beta hydrolase [Paracoccaceae bacterium]|nr:alpha/beta hydrolase [Paracoccaceae bacterium]
MLIYLAVGLAATWLIACLAMIVFARALIYPFQPGVSVASTNVPEMRVETITAEDDTPLTLWLAAPGEGRPVVLYFMGNGGALAGDTGLFTKLVGVGFGVAALNYRGAAGTPGEPSQERLTADALMLYDALDVLLEQTVPPERRVFYGSSLGAALALQLAARREAAALVLETPFNRLCEVAQHHFPIFPACLLLPYEHWASSDLIARINAPLLILHGDADETIPLAQGRALFEAAPQPKRLIVYPGGRHNDLRLHGAGMDAIAFIEAVTGD